MHASPDRATAPDAQWPWEKESVSFFGGLTLKESPSQKDRKKQAPLGNWKYAGRPNRCFLFETDGNMAVGQKWVPKMEPGPRIKTWVPIGGLILTHPSAAPK